MLQSLDFHVHIFMRKDKKSFFDRLTGAMQMDDDYEEYEEEEYYEEPVEPVRDTRRQTIRQIEPRHAEPELGFKGATMMKPGEDQLAIDLVQTPEEIILRTIVAGVRPEDLEVSITRDSVTIKGTREEETTMSDHDYFHRELFWGTFSRTINLPTEVNVEEADAFERHGLLTIVLPKIDRGRETRLSVKAR